MKCGKAGKPDFPDPLLLRVPPVSPRVGLVDLALTLLTQDQVEPSP